MLDDVDVVAEGGRPGGFEVERIVGDEDGGIGAALDLEEAANFFESAAAGGDVVVGFVGFEMLSVEIEEDVAAGDDFGGGVVVFDVIGTEAHAAVGDVHVVVGDVQVADAALRTAGGDFGDAAFDGGRANLLGGNCLLALGEKESRQRRYPGKEG